MRKIPNINTHIFKQPTLPWRSEEFYVRPFGGSYGLEDGTTYDNAFNGFASITTMPAGSVLFICGTHTETYTVGQSNLIIRGDYVGDAGTIDSQDIRTLGISFTNQNNNEIIGLSVISSIEDNILFQGTSDNNIVRNCYFEGSGNQSAQHENTGFTTYYYDCTFENNSDDGISLHDGTKVYIYDCTFNNNNDGVNNDSTSGSEMYIYDCVFDSNTNAVRIQSDVICEVERCAFISNTTDFEIITGSTTSPIISNCYFTGGGDFTTAINTGTATVNDCYFDGTGNIYLQSGSTDFIFNRCLFYKGNNLGIRIVGVNTINFDYCNFYNDTASSEFAIWSQQSSIISNCTFDGGGTGSGIRCVNGATIQNSILTNMSVAIQRVTGTVTADYCNFFNTTTKTSGTITNTNEVVGDPVIANEATLDFSIGIGSSCIGAGTTLTRLTGIDTADWGDGVSQVPIVTTKEQAVAWDIGAYIS